MHNGSSISGGLALAVAAGFILLIAAVWASGASTATSLAITGLLVLVGAATVGLGVAPAASRDEADEQRDRMRETTP